MTRQATHRDWKWMGVGGHHLSCGLHVFRDDEDQKHDEVWKGRRGQVYGGKGDDHGQGWVFQRGQQVCNHWLMEFYLGRGCQPPWILRIPWGAKWPNLELAEVEICREHPPKRQMTGNMTTCGLRVFRRHLIVGEELHGIWDEYVSQATRYKYLLRMIGEAE